MRIISTTTTPIRPHTLLCSKLLVTLLLMVTSGCLWAGTRTDVITNNISGTSSTYSSWTGLSGSASSAVYAGNTTGGTATLKIRPSDNSGIISTTSGGKLKSITVVWNSSCNDGATLEVYAKNDAYETTSDLYNSNKGSTRGTLVKGGATTTLTISGDYTHVGLRAKEKGNGYPQNLTLHFDEIRIEWESSSYSDKTATQTSFVNGESSYSVLLGEAFTAPTAVVTLSNGTTEVSGASVTYSSSNTNVATVDAESGAVSISATGTTTITAAYAGDQTYEASSATYTLTVTNANEFTWDATLQGYSNMQRLTTVITTPVQMVFAADVNATSTAYSTETKKAVCFYTNNTLTISAPEGYAINGISFNFLDTYNYQFAVNVGHFSTESKVGTWTGISPYVVVRNATGVQSNFSSITVSYTKLTKVGETTVKSVGMATYCPVGQTVVVGDGTKTFIYTGVEANGTTLIEKALPVVPVGTGVMIQGVADTETTYNLYSSDALTATAPVTNLLVGVTEANKKVPANSYVLQNGVVGLAFYYVNETLDITIGAGKAYLKGDALGGGVKANLFFRGGEEPDPMGISTMTPDESPIEAIYNMQGIRQSAPQRGINIIRLSNGRTIKRIMP